MMEKISFKIFTICMLACAALAVGGLWFEQLLPEAYFKAAATCFVVGLAGFLIWAPIMTYRFLAKLSGQN